MHIFVWPHFNVTPTSFCLKCINQSGCTKFCSTDKLETANKYFGLLTKNDLMDLQIRGLKYGISRQYFACVNRCTHVIFLAVGPWKPLLMIIKKLNLFLSSQKALTANFRVFFLGSLVFNLRFEKFPSHRFFSDLAENLVNIHRYQI